MAGLGAGLREGCWPPVSAGLYQTRPQPLLSMSGRGRLCRPAEVSGDAVDRTLAPTGHAVLDDLAADAAGRPDISRARWIHDAGDSTFADRDTSADRGR